MTGADTIKLLQQQVEELNHANDRQTRELENLRRHALMFDDYERPELVLEALWHRMRWPRARWQELADLIARLLSETRP